MHVPLHSVSSKTQQMLRFVSLVMKYMLSEVWYKNGCKNPKATFNKSVLLNFYLCGPSFFSYSGFPKRRPLLPETRCSSCYPANNVHALKGTCNLGKTIHWRITYTDCPLATAVQFSCTHCVDFMAFATEPLHGFCTITSQCDYQFMSLLHLVPSLFHTFWLEM